MMDKESERLRRIIDMHRKANRPVPTPRLNPRLAGQERVFRVPPLTQSLVNVAHRITPNLMHIEPDEAHRDLLEAEENGTCWAEFEHLRHPFIAIQPKRILEIGPGIGRSLVFFSHMLGWRDCDLHAYEGDGATTRYMMNGPRFEDSFCGDIAELRRVLAHNGVHNVTIHDAASTKLIDVPGPFDLVYGFYTIGFHWSLEHFMPDLHALMGRDGSAVFTVPRNFRPFAALEQLSWRIVSKEHVLVGKPGDGLLLIGPVATVAQ